jgi:hypothetical protein
MAYPAKPTQTVQLLEIELRLLVRAWGMRQDRAIAAEIERSMARTQMRFVVGAVRFL